MSWLSAAATRLSRRACSSRSACSARSSSACQSARLPLTPAISYARDGWPVIAGATEAIVGASAMFTTEWTSSAAVYMPDGKKAPMTGSFKSKPDLEGYWVHDTFDAKMVSSSVLSSGVPRSFTRLGTVSSTFQPAAEPLESMIVNGSTVKLGLFLMSEDEATAFALEMFGPMRVEVAV